MTTSLYHSGSSKFGVCVGGKICSLPSWTAAVLLHLKWRFYTMYQVLPVWVNCRFHVQGYVWSRGRWEGGHGTCVEFLGRVWFWGACLNGEKQGKRAWCRAAFGAQRAERQSGRAAAKTRLHAHNQPGCSSASKIEAVVCLSYCRK